MSEKSETDEARVQALAKARGLDRALARDPAVVTAAVARGTTAIGPLPPDFPTAAEPAIAFDPEKFASHR